MLLEALVRAPGLPPTPANWTLDNLAGAMDQHFLPALGNSLFLAVAAATGAVVIGIMFAVGRRRRLGIVLLAGFALPGSASRSPCSWPTGRGWATRWRSS